MTQVDAGIAPAMLVERARAMRPRLREQQEANDQRGYYSDEIHQAFLRNGFYRILQPKRFGGYEMDFVTFAKVIMEISQGHPASGWCYTLAASHALLVASHWSEEAQAELFGAAGDFRSPHRAAPAGTFERTEGGYIVNGVWSYSSGAPVCTHFIGAGVIPVPNDKPRMINFIVPREKIEILQDWGGGASLGMEGSGSHSVKITDVFVPDRHVTDWNVVLTLADFSKGTPGTRLHGNPMYLGVMGGAYHTTFGAMLTGTARAALEEYEEVIRTRKVLGNPDMFRMNDPEHQRAFGTAMGLADTAEAATLAAAQMYMDQCDRWATDGTPITPADTRPRSRSLVCYGAKPISACQFRLGRRPDAKHGYHAAEPRPRHAVRGARRKVHRRGRRARSGDVALSLHQNVHGRIRRDASPGTHRRSPRTGSAVTGSAGTLDYRDLQRRRVLEPRKLQRFVCTPGGCLPFRIQTSRTSPRAGTGNAAAASVSRLLLTDVRIGDPQFSRSVRRSVLTR
jgi:3-hydroxy-9,10-secoandrosta-1,3,5(10)-triene-9,17-dione monooxygenase